jgi:hypothetical protein
MVMALLMDGLERLDDDETIMLVEVEIDIGGCRQQMSWREGMSFVQPHISAPDIRKLRGHVVVLNLVYW